VPSILLDTYIFTKPAGGMAKVTAYLYNEIFRLLGEDAKIQGISPKALNPASPPMGLSNHVLPLPLGRETWRSLVLPFYSRWHPHELIHFPANGLIPAGLPSSSKIVSTLHDVLQLDIDDFYTPERAEKRQDYIQRLTRDLARTDLLITISDYSKQRILHHFPTLSYDPIVIPNAPTLHRPDGLSPQWELKPETAYFLYTGRYEKRKGLEWFLDSFLEGHRQQKLHSRLILTGESAFISEAFSEKVKTAKALGVLEERGYVSDAEMCQLMNQAVALVYPSFAEGFGLPPLEAMTLYCPVITTALTALPFTCGPAAHYVDPQAPESLLNALCRLEQDAPYRRQLIEAGLKQIQYFSWTRSAEAFLAAVSKA
jgi:glycosyltransferase involved in cell wall biosynthesis